MDLTMDEVILLTNSYNLRMLKTYGDPKKRGKIDNKTGENVRKKVQTMEEALEDLTLAAKKYPGKLDCIVDK